MLDNCDKLKNFNKTVKDGLKNIRKLELPSIENVDVLIILLDNKPNKEGFAAELRKVVEGLGEVRAPPKKVTLEIPDLGPLFSKEEIKVDS